MSGKNLVITVISIFVAVFFISSAAPASAACRDDCYSDCCGGELCTTDDQIKCLSDCLEGCGGDDVPEVPEPAPADSGDTSG